MKVTAVIASFVALATAAAVEQARTKATMRFVEARGLNDLCPPLETPLCCETVAAGAVGLTCEPRPFALIH